MCETSDVLLKEISDKIVEILKLSIDPDEDIDFSFSTVIKKGFRGLEEIQVDFFMSEVGSDQLDAIDKIQTYLKIIGYDLFYWMEPECIVDEEKPMILINIVVSKR